MRLMVKLSLLMLVLLPTGIYAQTDSIRLLCPLNDAVVIPPPKNSMYYDQPDLCIVLTSIPDTIVKACTAGKITNVTPSQDEEGKWDVVLFRKYKNKDYYFWYTGLEKAIVRRNDNLQEGQSLGYIKSGGKIELLMYDFETPVDPMKYLNCPGVLKH